MAISTGPSIRAVCRILNQNSCGSGSICGIQPNGRALIMTNAHVAGTQVGRVVNVDVESTGDRIQARVIMAAYSDRVIADWAVLETVTEYKQVEPVFLSKKMPTGSHYTKGFPRCRAHNGTDITTAQIGSNGVWYWEPDAIGGQSGSGVWSDTAGHQFGLLTWQWGQHGAGQFTANLYKQSRSRQIVGYGKPDGLVELENEYDLTDEERGDSDPLFEPGFYSQMGVADLPIWAEDNPVPPVEPPEPGEETFGATDWVEHCRRQEEFWEAERLRYDAPSTGGGGDGDCNGGGSTYGL